MCEICMGPCMRNVSKASYYMYMYIYMHWVHLYVMYIVCVCVCVCVCVYVCVCMYCLWYRVYDLPESELLKHWDDTYKFIKEVK